MADPSSIAAALGSIKAIYELLKSANDTHLAVRINAEVANVQAQLIDVQQQSLDIQADNQRLREELQALKSYVHHHSVVWRVRPDGTEEGPFCPACFGEGRNQPLIPKPHVNREMPFWVVYCPRGHADPKAKFLEPTYEISKELVPGDRY